MEPHGLVRLVVQVKVVPHQLSVVATGDQVVTLRVNPTSQVSTRVARLYNGREGRFRVSTRAILYGTEASMRRGGEGGVAGIRTRKMISIWNQATKYIIS